MTDDVLRAVRVNDGIVLVFHDRTNRYFGDYHRILIEVDVLLTCGAEETRLRYQRPLRRMAVASADVDALTTALVDTFLATTGAYMLKPGFSVRLLESLQIPGQKVWRRLDAGD